MTRIGRGDVVAAVRAAVGRGDDVEVGRLIAAHPIEIWFGMTPADVHDVVDSLRPGVLPANSVAAFLMTMASGEPLEGRIASDPAWAAALVADEQLRTAYVFLQATQARVAGDPVRAYEILAPLIASPPRSRLYRDTSGGLDAMVLLQAALAAALAGFVREAMALYDRVLLNAPREPALAFFIREAYVRSALLMGLYGDRADARARLQHAREVERTGSWVEHLLDAEAVLVDALLAPPEDHRAAVERVLALPLQYVGEQWPYYVSVLHRLTVATGLRARGRERIETLEASGIAPPPGVASGLPGSVFAIAYAWDDLMTGDTAAARAQLDRADPTLIATRLLSALHAVFTGATQRALQLSRAVSVDTRGFEQVESMRLTVIAAAHFVANERDEAAVALHLLAPLLDTHTISFLRGLSVELAQFAADNVVGWPRLDDVPVGPSVVGLLDGGLLTARELDVLRGLAAGRSREEVAAALFLSVNTVKTHQQSLYRKLKVSSGSAAVAEGIRRGLV
ncbi:response regulator transcription factor [Microbacterium sp.]|uniref:helix-turn-helix transcriptional regulator n=1 Tax=Microbacterium sp. TaxID=51671 RepID=UPI003C71D0A8